MIALFSKCYYVDEKDSENKKLSKTGMSKGQNNITWERFKATLNGSIDREENRGFHMVKGRMVTYEQQKLGLSTCDKRWVLPDRIHTGLIKFHTT